jgi:hypothetical protein
MHTTWKGIVVQDYELSRPDSTRLEWDLYTTSLITWPKVWMDEPVPYGRLRRPGIVDIDRDVHARLVAQLEEYLADPGRALTVVERAIGDQERTAHAVAEAEEALARKALPESGHALATATSAFLKVMSTHIVNWLLPEQQWEDLLARLFADRTRARTCVLALSTPVHGHLLDAHRLVLEAAASVRAGRPLEQAAALVTARAGTLYGHGSPAAAAMPLEAPEQAAELVRAVAESHDPEAQFAAIDDARIRAAATREAWESAALLAAAGDRDALARVRAMTTVLGWAAESEERRKETRHRYLAAVRRWCESTGARADRITTTELLSLGA